MKGPLSIALVLALLLALRGFAQSAPRSIPSLSEEGEELTVRDASPRGLVTFAGTSGRGILLPATAGGNARERALGFVASYGKAFGLQTAKQVQVLRSSRDKHGIDHVRLQQVHGGVPVRGAELIVHLKGPRVLVANGHVLDDLPDTVSPVQPASIATLAAQRLIQKHLPDAVGVTVRFSEPHLEILNRALLGEPGRHPSHLAWFIEAMGPGLRQLIWIDAKSGVILLSFSQRTEAKARMVYTAGHTQTLPGTLVRPEGGAATADVDVDDAYDFAGSTYDYYQTTHGRDSFDDAGATIVSTTHYCETGSCPTFHNAFWDGTQMAYGDGFASADDVVGHELTHAVTERTAGLLYYNQSGALNESFSDIFGESIDLTNGAGTDTPQVRWLLGEDLPIGALRNMMTPGAFSDPGKLSDSSFVCSARAWTDSSDNGGVHQNSGVPNHAYALMVDGGTYNGRTITGIGLDKAAKIQYRALTEYLTSGANFIDDVNALNQSCADLTGTDGISGSDCVAVSDALLAVEMNQTWPCSGATSTPAMCPSGIPSYTAFDGFEAGDGNWTATNAAGSWNRASGFASRGTMSQEGQDGATISDHRLTMTVPVLVPAGGRFFFDHAFEFESGLSSSYDGGVLEYSTNGGGSWTDAFSLIDAGQTYGGTISSDYSNPLAGRLAFVRSTFGYTGTRLSLSSLAGQSIQFRFRIGTDANLDSLGWFVDNAAIYSCVSSAFTDAPLVAQSTGIRRIHIVELRSRIDSLRILNGLAPFSWTDPTILAGTTPLRAAHITEMRTALAAVYAALGLAGPSYTDPGLAAGTVVTTSHVAEVRAAVENLE